MSDRSSSKALSETLDRAALFLTWIGGLCVVGIVVVIAAAVVMRYAFRSPVLGVNEIIELTAVALVMTALPYCTARNGHVGVDVFDAAIGPWGRFLGDLLSRLLSTSVLAVLAQRAVVKALDAFEWQDTTNMLGLPIWPFYSILAAGAALCGLIFLAQFLLILISGPRS